MMATKEWRKETQRRIALELEYPPREIEAALTLHNFEKQAI